MKMKGVVVLVAGVLVAGCAKSAPAPGKTVALENVCNEADGSRVRLVGYLRFPRELMSFCATLNGKTTCDLSLYAGPDKPADYDIMHPRTGPEPVHAKLSIPVGSAPGEMNELPKNFSDSDVVLHLQGDKKATDGTRITIDGKLSVIPGSTPKSCFVTVEWASAG